jgi:hypothetical protein
MENNILSAEEFLIANGCRTMTKDGKFYQDVVPEDLIKFTQMHVQAALKEASKKVYLSTYSGENMGKSALGSGNNGVHPIVEINTNSILNSYPLSLIK